jgi:hypothetical protein
LNAYVVRCESVNSVDPSYIFIGHVQVFFVPDKANPGWSVVVQKEARGLRINSTEEDLCIGQEESTADRYVLPAIGADRRVHADDNVNFDVAPAVHRRAQADRE